MLPEPTHRLFFALWPDERMRATLLETCAEAIAAADGKSVPAENLHVTVCFVGSVLESRIAQVRAIGADAVAAFRAQVRALPPILTFDLIEHWARPAVLCAAAHESPTPLVDAARGLVATLKAGGFHPDERRYHAHVTLKRKVRHAVVGALEPVRWPCTELRLVESRRGDGGSVYRALDSWVLYERGNA